MAKELSVPMIVDEKSELTARLRVLLPETYQVFDQTVQPRSMGSAGLKFGADGKVVWGEMWGSFCHLAMAGGPPHRGKLLQAAHTTYEEAQSPAYRAVTEEIARGIGLVTGLCAEQAQIPGWIQMYCTSAAMCGWLTRAIVMENVCAVSRGLSLYLPTGASFRVEKEIKNVITSVAKTCHYWQDHMGDAQRDEIAALLASLERAAPLVQVNLHAETQSGALEAMGTYLALEVARTTGLETSTSGCSGWLGVCCRSVSASVWMMRTLAACNMLARREETVVFVPLNVTTDPNGERTLRGFLDAHRLACAFHVFD